MQSVRIAHSKLGPIPHCRHVQLAATKQRNHCWALFIDVLYTLTYITKIPVDECVKRMDDLPMFCVLPIGRPPHLLCTQQLNYWISKLIPEVRMIAENLMGNPPIVFSHKRVQWRNARSSARGPVQYLSIYTSSNIASSAIACCQLYFL